MRQCSRLNLTQSKVVLLGAHGRFRTSIGTAVLFGAIALKFLRCRSNCCRCSGVLLGTAKWQVVWNSNFAVACGGRRKAVIFVRVPVWRLSQNSNDFCYPTVNFAIYAVVSHKFSAIGAQQQAQNCLFVPQRQYKLVKMPKI